MNDWDWWSGCNSSWWQETHSEDVLRVIPVDMTEIAIGKGMPAGERELCMIKCGRFPSGIGGVALVTRCRVLCCSVIGIGGLVVIVLVAGNTLTGQTGIGTIGMATIAFINGMSCSQRKE